jgi:hypothetical protein
MDLTTVNNAVSDAAAGLPSGWTQFVNDNIGSAGGQQAIVNAASNFGISDPSVIAGLVNQATGMNVTPQQVTQVAQSTLQAPIQRSVVTPTPAPTTLSNMATPQFVGTSAPGAVGTNYGQASPNQISTAQQANPELSSALLNGTAAVNYDADTGTYNLINTQTGAPIGGNYQVQVGPNGTGINIPSGNGMIQVTAQTNANGTIAPVTPQQVLNVGQNAGAGGFAGGNGALMTLGEPLLAASFPALVPYIAAYNAADAANKGNLGSALINAAVSYAGFNPNSALVQQVKNLLPVDPEAPVSTVTTPTDTTTGTPTIGDTTGLGTTNYSIAPTGSTGTGLNVQQGTGLNLFDTSGVNPSTGLVNGLGLQAPGSPNLTSMGGGQGLTVPSTQTAGTNTLTGQPLGTALNSLPGATTQTPAVIGATSITPFGTGGLPINPATGATLGAALNNISTGVTTPSPIITNTGGNVVGTPPGQNTSTGVLPAATAVGAGLTAAQTAALAGGALASTLGTLATNKAISNAAGTQTTAANNVQNFLSNLYSQNQQAQAPYQATGTQAVGTLGSPAAQQYLTNQFNNQDLNAQLAPNYAFQLQQGLGQARNAANVGGGLLSGNTLQGLNTYAQNYAQGAYQNAFNNYQTQRQNIYSNLANQAGIGQTANQQLSSLGGQLANTYGNVTTGLAATQAGAQTAQAVNNANLLSNLANTATVAALA